MKLRIFTLIISLFLSSAAQSQSIDGTLEFANSQYSKGNYEQAISAYRRVLFFDSTGQFSDRSYYRLAQCYLAASSLKKSVYYYDLAYAATNSDSIKQSVVFDKAHLYILAGQPNYALMELASLGNVLPPSYEQQRSFYSGLIYFMNEKFDKSYKSFSNALDSNSFHKHIVLDSLFQELEDVNRLNPKLARYLSLGLPGLGQLYAGYPVEAANSFLISAAFWGLYFYTLQQYTLLDALLSVYPWFQRYYIGGHFRAGDLTEKKKLNRRNLILIEIVEIYKK